MHGRISGPQGSDFELLVGAHLEGNLLNSVEASAEKDEINPKK